MKNKKNKDISPNMKWEVIYEDESSMDIWRYDIKISKNNPYEVEILYKNIKSDIVKIEKFKKK